jgi:hypothetical protein
MTASVRAPMPDDLRHPAIFIQIGGKGCVRLKAL